MMLHWLQRLIGLGEATAKTKLPASKTELGCQPTLSDDELHSTWDSAKQFCLELDTEPFDPPPFDEKRRS